MNNRFTHRRPVRPRCQGFSLMEVLVAMLVLAIGLLGLASLQAQSLKFNHDAYVRSQATVLVYELMDKMRLSPNTTWDTVDPGTADCSDPAAAVLDSTPEMTLCLWEDEMASVLPGGNSNIALNAVDARMFDINIQWLDREVDNQADCDAIGAIGAPAVPSRVWDGTNCLVNQIWTVFP